MDKNTRILLLKVSILAIRADGNISSDDARKLEDLLKDLDLEKEDYAGIDKYWVSELKIPDLADEIISANLRREAFQQAVLLFLGRGMNQREHEFLEEFGEALELTEEECNRYFREIADSQESDVILDEPHEGVKPPAPADTNDLILKYAIWGGSLGLTPIPVISDFFVLTPLQMKMVYEIGKNYGYKLDRKSINEFSLLVGVAFGLKVIGSVMKVIPFIGALGSAAVAFSGTYAMGKTADAYFSRGRTVDEKELRRLHELFFKEGKKLYKTVEEKVRNVNIEEIKRKFRK